MSAASSFWASFDSRQTGRKRELKSLMSIFIYTILKANINMLEQGRLLLLTYSNNCWDFSCPNSYLWDDVRRHIYHLVCNRLYRRWGSQKINSALIEKKEAAVPPLLLSISLEIKKRRILGSWHFGIKCFQGKMRLMSIAL